MCYKRLGNLDKAAIALKKATLLNPDDPLSHFQIGQVYLALGKMRLAYNELNILQIIGSEFYDSLSMIIDYNLAKLDSVNFRNENLD